MTRSEFGLCLITLTSLLISTSALAQGAGPSGRDGPGGHGTVGGLGVPEYGGPRGLPTRIINDPTKGKAEVATSGADKNAEAAPASGTTKVIVKRAKKSEVPPLEGTPDNPSGTNSGINGN